MQYPLSRLRRQLSRRESQGGVPRHEEWRASLLPLPLGEVAEQSEDGEGKPGCNALSVTCGDSSPKGRAKGGVPRHEKWRASPLPLPLGEVAERSEDGEGRPGAKPSQLPTATALPKGEPRGVPFISAPPGSWYRSFPASASRPGALPAPTP